MTLDYYVKVRGRGATIPIRGGSGIQEKMDTSHFFLTFFHFFPRKMMFYFILLTGAKSLSLCIILGVSEGTEGDDSRRKTPRMNQQRMEKGKWGNFCPIAMQQIFMSNQWCVVAFNHLDYSPLLIIIPFPRHLFPSNDFLSSSLPTIIRNTLCRYSSKEM
jgi:hypothetical protein